MELHDWMVHSRFITKDEYKTLVSEQFKGSLKGIDFDEDGLLKYPDPSANGSNLIQKHPIGDVLDAQSFAQTAYQHAGVANLGELIVQWQRWHVDNLEPIANYSTTSRFGKNLYKNVLEKKLVAKFITRTHISNAPLINRGDTVIIPEGSSAFYVGLAIASVRKNITIATSNAPLIREYVDNPEVARALNEFHVIGGLVDRHLEARHCDHGGVFGQDAEKGYELAIHDRPSATVVIMPVSGLLAEEGPYATEDFVRQLKYAIAHNSLRGSKKIHEFVFVADYSKHDSDNAEEYGSPVFDRDLWQELISENSNRVSLVTIPPLAIRKALALDGSSHPVNRNLDVLQGPLPYTKDDHAYCQSIQRIAKMFIRKHSKLSLHEVYETDDSDTLSSPSLQLALAHR